MSLIHPKRQKTIGQVLSDFAIYALTPKSQRRLSYALIIALNRQLNCHMMVAVAMHLDKPPIILKKVVKNQCIGSFKFTQATR